MCSCHDGDDVIDDDVIDGDVIYDAKSNVNYYDIYSFIEINITYLRVVAKASTIPFTLPMWDG